MRSEARSGTKLPGGPTAGCQTWPFTTSAVMLFEIPNNVYVCRIVSGKQ